MVAAFMFGIITLVFYVIYESVISEDKEIKKKAREELLKEKSK